MIHNSLNIIFFIVRFCTKSGEARAELQRQREESATQFVSGTDILPTSVHTMLSEIHEMNQVKSASQARREVYARNMRAPVARDQYQLTPERWKLY